MVAVTALPLTANGKVDYRALTLPAQDSEPAVKPRNATEQQLLELWQGLLDKTDFGIEDNFFSLGGDSILSIQLVSRARAAGLQFDVRQLFEAQTIKALAALVSPSETQLASQAPCQGTMDLLPIQQDFFAQALAQPHHYNQAVMLHTPANLEINRLKQAVKALFERHDALRLRFDSSQARFKPLDDAMVDSAVVIAEGEDLAALTEHHQASLNFETGPVFKAVYLPNIDGGRLLLIGHHLVVDGVSWRVLLTDLQTAWKGVALPAKTHSIAHWQQALADWDISEQSDFWQSQWRNVSEVCPPSTADTPQTQQISVRLDKADTALLLGKSLEAYRNKVPELLLTALTQAWQQWQAEHPLVVALEGHGRETIDETTDLTDTVGWFTSLYPVAMPDLSGIAIDAAIKSVKDTLRAVPDNGLGYGVLKYLKNDNALVKAEQLEQAVLFNYLGQMDKVADQQSDFAPATENCGAVQQ